MIGNIRERFIWDVIFNPPTLFHNETLKGTHALFTFWSQNHPLYDPRSRSCHVIYERSFIFILFVLYPPFLGCVSSRDAEDGGGQWSGRAASRRTFQRLQAA